MTIVKRICLFSFLISILTVPATAQKKFEIAFNTGFAIPISGSSIPGIYEQDTQGNKTAMVITAGGGVNAGLTVGYPINHHVAALLNINHLFGIAGKYDQYPAKNTITPSATSITPAVRIATGDDKKINWNAKMGLSLVLPKLNLEAKVPCFPGSAKYEFSGNTPLGWLGAVGADIKLNERMDLSIGFEMRMATWNPAKRTNTENFGGPLSPTVEYEKYVPVGSTTKELPLSIPFNSIALNVGVKF